VLIPIGIATYILYDHRKALFGVDTPARVIAAVILLAVGWQIARDIGRSVGPAMFRRMDPATAGTAGFLLRLLTIVFVFVIAMRVVGLDPRTLAVGGAFTAVIFGLAAQQTLGNLIAGTVLLSARPFKVGDRVRLQGGQIAGQIEGVVSSLGLLYTTFASGEDSIMVPNNAVLNVAVVPLREPEGVDLRARLPADVAPSEVQALLQEKVQTPMRDVPRILLEELDGDDVVVRIQATPERAADGPKLATEVLAAVAPTARGEQQLVADGKAGE
jgi:small conductance mechanosensitive channel